MAEVECDVEYDDVTDDGKTRPGVRVTCSECDLVVESFGESGKSIRRCLAMLRDGCSLGEDNFYKAPGADE